MHRRRPVPLFPADPGRRLRLLATALLVVMAVAFVCARHFADRHPALGYAAAFAEAAMVGGLADWFAVTALFRRPLGLPIPHTAIIPANKDRIADSMAGFLRANFLTHQVVARRLHRLDVASLIGGYLANPGRTTTRIGDSVTHLLADILATLDPDKIGRPAKALLSRQIERIDLAPLLGQVLAGMIADGRHLPVIDSLLRRAGALLEANEDMLRAMIRDRTSTLMRWTRLDDRLASALLDALYALLAEMLVDQGHPLRRKIDETLERLAHDLVDDPALGARVAMMKADALRNPAFAAWLDALWERSRLGLIALLRAPAVGGMGELGTGLAGFGRALGEDAALRAMVNRFARRSLAGLASRHGDDIVRTVSETVRRWDAGTVTRRIESAVGRDLQFIRINGTVVGGLVGLALHALERFV
ncbi:DUF445 domain-containing protein [Novosphingobium sp.]|uniref:DUF445 domain-containing protein n=1 Tax=Novosphingobium sp. TaxID=1874826 RepID=UPI003341F337